MFLLGAIERQLVKAPLAAAISPCLISLTHPTHVWKDRPPHRELGPLLFSTSVWGSFTSHANHAKLKMQEKGPTVCSPYPRRLELFTI